MARSACPWRLAVIGLVWLAGGATSGVAADRAQVTLALPSVNIAFLSDYIADDLHFWSDAGIDVKMIVIVGAGATNAVIAGSADFAMTSGSSITRAWAHGQKLHALATAVNQTTEYVVLRKHVAEAAHFNPNASLAERAKLLRGKTIAMGDVGSLPDAVLKAVASVGGVRPDEIVATPMQPVEFMAAFQRKIFDGFANSMPYVQQVVLDGTGVLLSDTIKGEPERYSPVAAAMLLARANYCDDHHAICTTIVHGLAKAIHIIRTDPAQSMTALKAHFGTYTEPVLKAS
jgi:ABC-type nitrate/sulfonate/bicarbonate transport system substrate-binding protein